MAQEIMYIGRVNSPITKLTNTITASQTTIEVSNISVFPSAPNLATIGIDETAETVLYTEINGNILTVTRGFQGTAKAWDAGTPIGRNFTEYDYNILKNNIEDIYGYPFKIKSAFYTSSTDTLSIIIAPGTGETFNGAMINTITKTSDTTFNISTPSASTIYTIYLENDGNFASSIDGTQSVGSLLIGAVNTNADKSVSTIVDKRPLVSGVGKELITHENNSTQHKQATNITQTGINANAEGTNTTASGGYSHAEGHSTTASGYTSHAEGDSTSASGTASHAEGQLVIASGYYSHAQNQSTIAQGQSQTAIGEYNIAQGTIDSRRNSDYAFIIGNGTSDTVRSNALTVDWAGNLVATGSIRSKLTPIFIYSNTTLALIHAGQRLFVNSTSDITITVPLNSSVAFSIGDEIEIIQYGTGTVTIAYMEGVTIRSYASLLRLDGQYSSGGLIKINTDEWLLVGALA